MPKTKTQAPRAATAPALQVTHEPVYQIPLTWLRPLEHNGQPVNPRRHFDPVKLQELADSMRQVGIQQPLVVRAPTVSGGFGEDEEAAFRLDPQGRVECDPREWTEDLHPILHVVAGERRLRAAELAGLESVPCYFRELTLEQAVDICIVENDQRSDLTAIERARGYRAWLDLVPGRTQAQLAQRIGVTQGQISNAIRLLQLPDAGLHLVEDGIVTPTHARDVLLQFATTPEPARSGMFENLAKAARKAPEAASTLEGLKAMVRLAAIVHSRPLATGERVYESGLEDPNPLFDSARHAQCGCGAPAFPYRKWDPSPIVRCFDAAWWDAAQAEAEQARETEKAAIAAETPDTTTEALTRKLGHGHVRIVASRKGVIYGHELLDPVALEGTSLTIAKDWNGNPMLVSLDPKAVQRAKDAADSVLQARLAERRAARREEDLAVIEGRDLLMSEVVSLLTSDVNYGGMKEAVSILRKEFGFKKNEADSRRLLQVLVLRHGRGDLAVSSYSYHSEPLAEKVKAELRADCEPLFRDLWDQVVAPKLGRSPAGSPPHAFADSLEAIDADLSGGAVCESCGMPGSVAGVLLSAAGLDGQYCAECNPDPEAQYPLPVGEARCRVCGCADSRGCPDGCTWVEVDREAQTGLCSSPECVAAGQQSVPTLPLDRPVPVAAAAVAEAVVEDAPPSRSKPASARSGSSSSVR